MEASGAAVPTPGALAAAGTVAVERVRALVLRYFVASTAFFLVAGVLGLIMRQSQADLARVGDNFWYAAMTAHGLGAFIAWAGFGIMGFSFWILKSVGIGMRPLGYRLGEITWWTMVLGTLGIVVSTLFLGFGGSWVFLYPLPFHAASQWSDVTSAIFTVSVLLAGVAIITWCLSILHTVVGPDLPAAKDGVLNRLGVALGLGILFPRRFPTRRGETFPYAVLPLTVIAIDMIVATTPLAGLLVQMTIEAFAPSVTVNPLLAKNILWFFGHPVVYLLLFPAVAAYYLLIPRYAGRELVAGRIIGVAWLLAVVVNVIIWAHHVYLDYPQDTAQASINIAMQPLTFSITLVSALSIYSLSATMYKSRFDWNPAAKFLVAGLFGWFTAGLSGVVNATIHFQQDIHNTLWVVGHFHHMALLNIGMVVFACAYAFAPELLGRPLYSRRLADWHLWLAIIGGYGMAGLWLSQGLTGAPRRWAILPETYDPETIAALPFILLIALGVLAFVWNMLQTARGRQRVDDDRPVLRDERQLVLTAGIALAFVIPLFAVGIDQREVVEPEAARAGATTGGPPGKQTFVQTCGGCHTLADAGSSGVTGPNLDQLKPNTARVRAAIARGGTGSGAMPPGLLTGKDADQVAQYVSQVAGK